MRNEKGFALAIVMMLLGVFAALTSAFVLTTKSDLATTRLSRNSTTGFYAAEGGLNLRAEDVRATFIDYNVPTGTAPYDTDACAVGNRGDGDFACASSSLSGRDVETYVSPDAGNPLILTIPPGERYQYLNAQEYRYTARSVAKQETTQDTEAILELRFKSRLVPLFQFAAFYNKDLEILPGPAMTLSGPIHTNGDLYLFSDGNSLTISGQVTTSGSLYRGRKNNNTCNNSPVRVYDPTTARTLLATCPTRTLVSASLLPPFNGMIQTGVPQVTVPQPEVFDVDAEALYWKKADLRIVLNVDASNNPTGATPMQVLNSDLTVNAVGTAAINSNVTCPMRAGSLSPTVVRNLTMYNFREAANIRLLDVDMGNLLDCLHRTSWFGTGKVLSENSEGGLVFHFTVRGPNSSPALDANSMPITANRYGVRIYNAQELRSTVAGAPTPIGLTVVSDQAMYVMGNYNSVNKKPAAVMADTINLLSNAWNNTSGVPATPAPANRGRDATSNSALANRLAIATTYNTAFLAGTDSTGNAEGTTGQNGAYNGGLENYPRLHENWANQTLTYRGSFVSLGRPRRVRGSWGSQSYGAPPRDWNYDTSFNNAANLPPITPRFVYLRQELFQRDFER